MKANLAAMACILVLAALAFSGCVSSSNKPMTFADMWTGEGFVSAMVGAVLLSCFFVALGYMLGYAFRQPRLVMWAKNEFYQVIASALLVAFILWFVTALSGLTTDLTSGVTGPDGTQLCGGTPSAPLETTMQATGWTTNYHIECARSMLRQTQRSLIVQADQLVSVNMRLQFLIGFTKSFDISPNPTGYVEPDPDEVPGAWAMGIMVSPYAGLTMMSDAVAMLMPMLFAWIASIVAQEFLLTMVQDALFPILLVIGIILRTFFFTRKLGGLLMATALCLYTIYPLMYIMFAQHVILPTDGNNIWLDRWNMWLCICDTDKSRLGLQAGWFLGDANCPVRFCDLDLIGMVLFGLTPAMASMFMTDWIFVVVQMLGRMMIATVLIPLIVLIVTVSSIKGLSPLLGGDVEIAGLTHLI